MAEDGVCLDDFQVGDPVVGEKIERMGIDREVETVIVPVLINEDIFVSSRGQREQIAGHVFIAFIEIVGRMDAVGEERKVFGEVPSDTERESDEEE